MASSSHALHVGRRLFGWSALSVATGLTLLRSKRPAQRGVGEQFVAWGAVDGAIAVTSLVVNQRRQASSKEQASKDNRALQRLLLANAGLDVLYVAGGAVILATRGRTDATWRGRALGVMIQGGFLLGFDLWHGLRIPASPQE